MERDGECGDFKLREGKGRVLHRIVGIMYENHMVH